MNNGHRSRGLRAVLACGAVTMVCGALAGLHAQDGTRPSFAEWLEGVRAEAIERGIRESVVTAALAGIEEPLAVVLERDRAQAEIVLPLETYINQRLTTAMVRNGRQMLAKHRTVLGQVEKEYGVPARYIVAIWGIESNYGRFTGTRPVVGALATLAWDPRRSARFRRELFDALEILNREYIELPRLRGSWAGAMGQPQFMPSSYLAYAVDFDGNGRRDIWSSPPDIFGSIANYLKGHGWTTGERWGREVRLSPEAETRVASEVGRRGGSCSATRDMTEPLPLPDWQALGVRSLDGGPLPKAAGQPAALVAGRERRFLVYHNYDVILEYNCAHAYALSVALLGDRIGL